MKRAAARWRFVGSIVGALAWAAVASAQESPFIDAGAAPPPTEAAPVPPPPTDPEAFDDPFAGTTLTPVTPSNPFEAPAEAPTNPFDAAQGEAPSASGFAVPIPVEAGEIRGLYVLASDKGFQTPGQLDDLVKDIQDAGFTRVYAEVRTVYGVAYPSRFENNIPTTTKAFPNPVRELRAKLGGQVRVIAVVNLLPAYSVISGGKPPFKSPLDKLFPDYLSRTPEGREASPDNFIYLDAGNPEVVRYLTLVIEEIDNAINPDGYLFTGVRYPGSEYGYSKGAIADFRRTVGGDGPPATDDPTWSAWRRDRLTQLLKSLRNSVFRKRPGVTFSANVDGTGAPPASWDEWLASPTYQQHMADWIHWGKESAVNELLFRVHERVSADSLLKDWVSFAGTHSDNARPLISLAGSLNFSNQLRTQMDTVRFRGLGTVLYQYAEPVRDRSRGFYSSMPTVFYKGPLGAFVAGRTISGTPEDRNFTRMFNPPPAMQLASAAATPVADPLGDKPLSFATPTPLPSPTPAPRFVPTNIPRKGTLRNGQVYDIVVYEANAKTIVIRQVKLRDGQVVEQGPQISVERSLISSIEPPL